MIYITLFRKLFALLRPAGSLPAAGSWLSPWWLPGT